MGKIELSEEMAAPASAAWEKLADFGGLDWMPGVEKVEVEGEGIGAVRTVSMGPMNIKERLESFDDAGRSLSYSITEGPMPVQNYLATIRVSESGDGCRVDWSASFDLPEGVPAEAIENGLNGAYGGARTALKKLVEG